MSQRFASPPPPLPGTPTVDLEDPDLEIEGFVADIDGGDLEPDSGDFRRAVQTLRATQDMVNEQARRMTSGVRALMDTGEFKPIP